MQSSLLAQIDTFPPRAFDIRGRAWIGEGPNVSSVRGMLAKGSGRGTVVVDFEDVDEAILSPLDFVFNRQTGV